MPKNFEVAKVTTWLDFRTEPLSDVPEIKINTVKGNPDITTAVCQDLFCNWFDTDSCKDDVESAAEIHRQWHEDGMPQDFN